jgi:hypothetical protein
MLIELLWRTATEIGTTITAANRFAGQEGAHWTDDAYGWNQALDAMEHILALSRLEGGRPHGMFASRDYPKADALKLGVLMADGILEVMRDRHRGEPGSTLVVAEWAQRIREGLGFIGERLDRHPSPKRYIAASRRRATHADAVPGLKVRRRGPPG